jgi:hypothetical protein
MCYSSLVIFLKTEDAHDRNYINIERHVKCHAYEVAEISYLAHSNKPQQQNEK